MKNILSQGAEAIILLDKSNNSITKQRIKKSYRITEIDEKIRKLRTRNEGKLLEKASKIISIPKVLKIDEKNKEILMEFINGKKLSENLDDFTIKEQLNLAKKIGESIGKLHEKDIIHGDLTTSNMILAENTSALKKNELDIINKVDLNYNYQPQKNLSTLTKSQKRNLAEPISKQYSLTKEATIFFIDFGLGFISSKTEDKAVDLHVLKQALEAKHFTNWQKLWKEIETSYNLSNKESEKVLSQLKKVEARGRYKC